MTTNISRTELYARQEPLSLNTNVAVSIVGCGGVGMWVAYFLALAGVQRIDLFDSDKVSANNLNRLPLTFDMVGQYKTVAAASLINAARPACDVKVHGNLSPDYPAHVSILQSSRWVVCSTDSLKSRQMTYDLCKKLKEGGAYYPRYLECGADGQNASLSFCPAELASDLESLPGYASVPVFVGPCTLVASIATYYVLNFPNGATALPGEVEQGMDRTFQVQWHHCTVDKMEWLRHLEIRTILDNDLPPALPAPTPTLPAVSAEPEPEPEDGRWATDTTVETGPCIGCGTTTWLECVEGHGYVCIDCECPRCPPDAAATGGDPVISDPVDAAIQPVEDLT